MVNDRCLCGVTSAVPRSAAVPRSVLRAAGARWVFSELVPAECQASSIMSFHRAEDKCTQLLEAIEAGTRHNTPPTGPRRART